MQPFIEAQATYEIKRGLEVARYPYSSWINTLHCMIPEGEYPEQITCSFTHGEYADSLQHTGYDDQKFSLIDGWLKPSIKVNFDLISFRDKNSNIV